MSESFLHGVEVVEIDNGARPISVVRTSVIGVVGTAPDSQDEVKASVATGVVASNNAITWTSKLAGALGNEISFELVDPASNNATLSISVTGKHIKASLATGATGAITTTAALLKTAIEANAAATALVGLANTGASTGASAVAALRRVYLTGGIDEAFPLNVPTLVSGSRAKALLLGSAGTLPAALECMFEVTSPVVVVVRVDEGADDAATLANVMGSANAGTGVYAFLGAESIAKVCPRILVAPGWTHQVTGSTRNGVETALSAVASRLRGFAYVDAPNTNETDAISYRQRIGSNRTMVIYPHAKKYDSLGQLQTTFPSAYWAAIRAKIDNEKGFWVSVSNQVIDGIVGVSKPIDFRLDDTSSLANVLNENEVSTIIQDNGYYTWGNRTCSDDPKWAFECVRRTADVVNESILRAHKWAVDRNITKTYLEDVVQGVNDFLSTLIARGAILGGVCWVDPDQNNPGQISQGKVYFNFDFGPTYPAEHMTFASQINNDYIKELF